MIAPPPPAVDRLVLPRLIHVSMVKFCNCKFVGLPINTPSPFPSKLNAWPTSPAAKAALPTKVPLLVPVTSSVFPFPGHHETSPEAGGVQLPGAVTVNSALPLLVVPKALLTVTEYMFPDWPGCTLVRDRELFVSPPILELFNRH